MKWIGTWKERGQNTTRKREENDKWRGEATWREKGQSAERELEEKDRQEGQMTRIERDVINDIQEKGDSIEGEGRGQTDDRGQSVKRKREEEDRWRGRMGYETKIVSNGKSGEMLRKRKQWIGA